MHESICTSTRKCWYSSSGVVTSGAGGWWKRMYATSASRLWFRSGSLTPCIRSRQEASVMRVWSDSCAAVSSAAVGLATAQSSTSAAGCIVAATRSSVRAVVRKSSRCERSACVRPWWTSTAASDVSSHSITAATTSFPCGVVRAGSRKIDEERVGIGLVAGLQPREPDQPLDLRPERVERRVGDRAVGVEVVEHAARRGLDGGDVTQLAGGEAERLLEQRDLLDANERRARRVDRRLRVQGARRHVGLGDRLRAPAQPCGAAGRQRCERQPQACEPAARECDRHGRRDLLRGADRRRGDHVRSVDGQRDVRVLAEPRRRG